MTKDQRRRVIEAIAECDRFVALEEPRNPDTRPASELKHLEFCRAHKIKLQAMLADLTA